MDVEKLLETGKVTWTKIEDLKNIKLNALLDYEDRHINSRLRTFGDKVYTNFRDLDVSEIDIECEAMHLDNCAYKI